jgi:hypothetical protein
VWHALWQQLRPLAALRPGRRPRDSTLAWDVDRSEERIRKEPLRLTAEQATLASETFGPPDPKPLVHASIAAPTLTVDIVNRQIVTTGDTVLGLIDRRGVADTESAGAALGLPSGLLSRGASQTAMRCAGRMTYTLGPEGPDRRDTAVFEDQVLFLHCTGKEMDNLAYMLPQVVQQPELIDALKSRLVRLECARLESWFTASEGGTSLARAGGAFTRSPLKLSSLLASGDVYLRDREDSRIREVDAAWIEFNRDEGRITVRGTDTVDARVYSEDPRTGQFGVIAGRQLVVNLKDGTVRSEQIAGEMRRK